MITKVEDRRYEQISPIMFTYSQPLHLTLHRSWPVVQEHNADNPDTETAQRTENQERY